MPGLTGNPHHLYDRHLRICQESTFGACPGSPSWSDVPLVPDGFTLKATSPRMFPRSNVGGYRRQIGVAHQQTVHGELTTPAWVEHTDLLLAMALTRTAGGDLYSHTCDLYTPADARRVLGAVGETLHIEVNGAGAMDVRLNLGLRAKQEVEHPDSLAPGDFDYSALTQVPFMLRDAVLKLDTTVVADVERFRISVDNRVAAGPIVTTSGSELGTVAYLLAGRRELTLELAKVNCDDRFSAAIRAGETVSFEADFVHPDGHLWQIKLPVLAPEQSDEDVSVVDPTREQTVLHALTDSDDEDILWAVDIGPSTTTMAPLTTTGA
jgi:tail tube protein